MSLNKRQREELSGDMKTLLKAGYIDDNLTLTSFGKTQLINYLLDEYKEDIVQDAERILDKRKGDEEDDVDMGLTIETITNCQSWN